MTDPAVPDLTRYLGKEVLLDANILLLYIVGLLNRSRIPKFKRTKMFAVEDFDTLVILLKKFRAVVTTPNILTEISNLGGELGDPVRSEFFTILTRVIPFFTEKYIDSQRASQVDRFPKCGLTDATILEVASHDILVVTVDFDLVGFLNHRGAAVLNFNNLRSSKWKN